ncbi:MAG: 16S rRNA (uracil(1498)-N(3))-methyltransferase [Proteobacteria bacterium]|nr:16S rRNA (uracil(1498)-N(3))-methyltransferase [Pseudomonadota bacterium]
MAKSPPRLFVEEPLGADLNVGLTPAHVHYLKTVLRLKPNDVVALFNGRDGEWHGELTSRGKSEAFVALKQRMCPQDTESSVAAGPTLMFAPIKRGPMEILVQKSTELGVTRLQPMITEYTDVVRINAERLRATAIEAAEQCERLSVPSLGEPKPLMDILGAWPKGDRLIWAAEAGPVRPIAEALAEFKPAGGGAEGFAKDTPSCGWTIAVGPVGGFSPAEQEILRGLAFVIPVGLGPRLLKAETAALAALSCWQSVLGDWAMRPIDRNHQ